MNTNIQKDNAHGANKTVFFYQIFFILISAECDATNEYYNNIVIQEFEKNWEESRQGRVDSWLAFAKNNKKKDDDEAAAGGGKEKKKKKEKKFSPIGFRPPKTKPESR